MIRVKTVGNGTGRFATGKYRRQIKRDDRMRRARIDRRKRWRVQMDMLYGAVAGHCTEYDQTREKARRLRQIERGQLTGSNGLVLG